MVPVHSWLHAASGGVPLVPYGSRGGDVTREYCDQCGSRIFATPIVFKKQWELNRFGASVRLTRTPVRQTAAGWERGQYPLLVLHAGRWRLELDWCIYEAEVPS